ncbi:MAG: Peptide deformylase [Parcubacteria group bacterium GW2011_GWF2_39_8b]|uniref:Peptide deformylase n=1 Tax=Candidatus Zambryskibacteria bacterium RIFCSPHIGHO2_12_FULL_38_37 TaxID=1802751 RepID=A0A1G2TPK7_9BACT|nr:MAG: Peptide deformylase [Parcubacteria group bacterium GW2011_GWF2_39_8b]KKR45182.1 MAG: Peptide deformylase [Parcubacteria group bacterium GW2011_GWA2_40_14]OHA98541.1 MAG: hypothetical protein A3E32_03170 [Candidatus Zambryskibacteria bacterium RIFCSPHIGHO2_12_FULL_38_37]OHB07380.1 MAG: hypothetical protein A2W64_00470 [Candidatus Zambryskibacteria bacterium RIFCSPLOWO2_02_39_10]OHB09413.1 MAG: hypothetical protein A3I21_01685 [Candidatus Zambryskibacteria bacterium RIFCSPLOWO2_02_FULL_39
MKKILQKDAPVLRKIAKEIPLEAISSPKIKKIISEMKEALASQDDGVAIAAPQIGYSLCIFVMSKKVEGLIKGEKIKSHVEPELIRDQTSATTAEATTVYINPVIKKISKEKKMMEEGCLSVRYLYGKVSRGSKVVLEAYDETGKKFIKGASGLLSQIFQHETDHLNGVLFIDKAKNIEEIIPAKANSTQIHE